MHREMRNSGIKWFNKIPSEWKVTKVKQLFSIGRGRVIAQTELVDNGLYPVYSSQTKNNGCLGYINSYDFDKDQLTWTTDGANAGTVFLREGKHNCTNVCGTLVPKNKENNLIYLKYMLEYTAIFHKRADTNGFKIMNNEMADISILLPSKMEQEKIANYLDKKVSQIDDIISKQKSLVEKYKAYKQSLITETVIKGLDKNVLMKDSGIEWIGRIPSHWEVEKMKYLGSLNSSGVDKKIRSGEKLYKSVHYVNVYKNGQKELINKEDYLVISCDNNKARNCTLLKGDVLFTNSSETADDMGVSTVVSEDLINTLFGYHLMRFRPFPNKLLYKYEKYLFSSNYMRKWFAYNSVGMTRYGLSQRGFSEAQIIFAPYDEQKQIASFLDRKCSAIDSAITKKEQLIEKLETYKKSLIYECVTGKREVN